MAEKQVGLIAGTLLGPWFGEVYDIILTDRRFVFVFVEKFGLKTRFDENPNEGKYANDSLDSLAAREGTITIPYTSVRHIRMKGVHKNEGGMHYLYLEHTGPDEKKKKLKILLWSPTRVSGDTFWAAARDSGTLAIEQNAIQLKYANSVKQKLERVLPVSVLQDAEWHLEYARFP